MAEQFQAPVTDTRWQVVESPLECSLTQTIPGYGEAGFYQGNGSPLTLKFSTRTQPAKQAEVQFAIAAAPWQNSDEYLPLSRQLTHRGQTEFTLEGSLAQQALNFIQQGRFPIISYPSQTYNQQIEASLSTVKLNDSLPAFQQCQTNLHPDTFSQVKNLTIYFKIEQSSLDSKAQKALTRLADYIKLDDSISQVKITSHTDNHGRRRINEPLSDARAITVRDFLVEQNGVDAGLISIRSHIDHQPADSNNTLLGRAKNRRAEITLIR